MDLVDQKADLRTRMKRVRHELSSEWCQLATQQVFERLSPLLAPGMTLSVFRAMPGEPRVADLFDPTRFRLALPRVFGDQLLLYHWEGQECLVGPFGILEPSPNWPVMAPRDIDLFLVPGLAFDRHGGRLGFGRGFYDRLLPQSRGLRVGISWENQLVERVRMDPHDVWMDMIVTEQNSYHINTLSP